jgi:hypothetical protein
MVADLRMADICTYLSGLWSGNSDAFWPHLILLSGSVLAGIAVGAGIIFESPRYSASIHRIATWLVISGVFVESLCTICLFVVDERISDGQNAKIITLESRLSARTLSDSDIDHLQVALRKFAGQRFAIATYPEANEPSNLARVIKDRILIPSGWIFISPAPRERIVGVMVGVHLSVADTADERTLGATEALLGELTRAGIDSKRLPDATYTDRIEIFVGIKP